MGLGSLPAGAVPGSTLGRGKVCVQPMGIRQENMVGRALLSERMEASAGLSLGQPPTSKDRLHKRTRLQRTTVADVLGPTLR